MRTQDSIEAEIIQTADKLNGAALRGANAHNLVQMRKLTTKLSLLLDEAEALTTVAA